ncbi:hypothetical protein [Saccharopolyspora sp. NPDC002686]|uniref:hypothetical protein n=1 Tax=Saccharopolyspora sp. NPDC002686 TaxID=3154541 RepID=UPI00331F2FB7
MRTLLHLQRTHARLEAVVHLCCRRLVPAITAELSRGGTAGELTARITARAAAPCRGKR